MRVAELGMTKEEFYEKSGISSASYSQWNAGPHAPTKKKMAQAAAALNVSLEYILTGETKKEPTATNGSELSKKGKEIGMAYDAAVQEVRARMESAAFGRAPSHAVAKIEMVCSLGHGKQTIYQPVYCVAGKAMPFNPNNGCEHYHACPECEICRANAILKSFECDPLDCDLL
jgi:transcriptional regulator with XRE-family HTH domain